MPDIRLPESVLSSVDAIINAELASKPAPGVALGIVRDGALASFRAYGKADLKTGEPPTQRSIARVASVTKTFTATAIMQLRDESLLELDDPLLLHIPEFTNARAKAAPLEAVTIRRLLTHHSGLTTEHSATDWDGPSFPSREQMMDSLETVEVVIQQDSRWKYSNLAYALLGEVVSRLSGKPYADYIRDRITGPLDMRNSVFDLSPEQSKLKMTGYSPALPGENELRPAPMGHLNGLASAGQLQTNVEDLAKWLGFQMGSGPESVLSNRSIAEMHRPVYIERDWSSGQCLGWRATRLGERVYLNHGGAVHGFSTSVFFNVPARTGVIILVNLWPASWSADLPVRVLEAVIDGAAVAKKPTAASIAPASSGTQTEYDGSYRAEPGISVTVTGSANGLVLSKPGDEAYTLHAPATLDRGSEEDQFTVADGRGAGETAVFDREESGRVTGFRLGGFLYRRVN